MTSRLKSRRKVKSSSKKRHGKHEPTAKQITAENGPVAEERRFSKRLKVSLIVTIISLSVLSASFLFLTRAPEPEQTGQSSGFAVPRAAILDALYTTDPNENFTQSVIGYLTYAGLQVDVFRGENVSIDLLENIGGYRVIILRVHSAVHTNKYLYVFSGEIYTESGHLAEEALGGVREARPDEGNKSYFALNALFLGTKKPEGLQGSTIVLMGCNGTGDPSSIQRLFIERGIKAYVAWNGYVDLAHSDNATMTLVKALYAERLDPAEAVQKTMNQVGPDPFWKSVLECNTPENP